MASSNATKGLSSRAVASPAPESLVERQALEATGKPEIAVATQDQSANTRDHTFAGIHTGDRAVHEPVLMMETDTPVVNGGATPGQDIGTQTAELPNLSNDMRHGESQQIQVRAQTAPASAPASTSVASVNANDGAQADPDAMRLGPMKNEDVARHPHSISGDYDTASSSQSSLPTAGTGESRGGLVSISNQIDRDSSARPTTGPSPGNESPVHAPILSVQAAAGFEDQPIRLNIAAQLAVADGTDTLSITVIGVPEGATLSAGTQNPDGSWVLTADQLTNLTLTPAEDSSGDFILTVTATATDMPTGIGASTIASFPVAVEAVLDPPVLSVEATAGLEDATIPLAISVEARDGIAESEIFVAIAGLPEGAVLSAGALQPDGAWLLTADQLDGLLLTPPQDFHGDIRFAVTATSRDADGAEASEAQATVHVGSVADAPIVTVQDATGREDTPIALTIAGISGDLTGADMLSPAVSIAGVPEGAALSAGARNTDGTWSVPLDELAGLAITPPADSDEDFTLSVTFTATDALGNAAETTAPLTVAVEAVADLPAVSIAPISGDEDSFIPLNIAVAPTDTDGSQSLSFTISGIPEGVVLSAGADLGGGVWSIESEQLAGLAIRPPIDFSGEILLTLTAVATENAGASATTAVDFSVQVDGVADSALVSVADAVGFADGPIPLSISAELTDRDGSETLGPITISGLPAGATLSAGIENPDGTWTLDAAQLEGLTLTSPPGDSNDFTLHVEVATVDVNGNSTSTGLDLDVRVAALPDLAAITPVSGTEDAAVALDIAGVIDGLEPGETLTVTVSGLPDNAVLSAGTQNPDGTWTLTGDELAGLTLLPPPDFAGDIQLDLILTTQAGEIVAVQTATLDIHIAPVPDAPSATVSDASGSEDTSIPLDITVALNPADDAGALMVAISGVPDGAALSAGTINPDGEWILSADQIQGLAFIPAPDASGTYALTVTPIAVGEDGRATSGEPVPLAVEVLGEADTPELTVSAATGIEDQPIALDIAAILTDLDGSEALTVTVAGLPEGATLSAGTRNPDGTWSLSASQLTNLTVTPAAHSSDDFILTVTATARETDNGDEASTVVSVPVAVLAAADAPMLTGNAASGSEDTAIPLDIAASLIDSDGSETLSLSISDVPEGAILSAGTQNPDGTWTLTVDQLTDLTVTPPENSSENFTLTVAAIAVETATGDEATTTISIPVTVEPVVDTPTLLSAPSSGLEDTAISLDITAGLVDPAGSETLTILVEGVPEGATLSAGTRNPDGAYTLTADELAGLTVTPAADSSDDFTLTVTATATDGVTGATASTTATVPVTVIDVVDAPSLLTVPVTGLEDTAIALDISAGLVAPSASETLMVTIDGLPEGATLSAGTLNADGTYTLTADELAGLTVTPAADSSDDFTLTVTATATDGVTGATASTTATVPVTVIDVVDAPSLLTVPVTGLQDTAIPLEITAGLVAPGDSETLTVTIDGLPQGATLSAGVQNADGSWTLTGDELAGLTLSPAPGSGEDFTLTVTATATDGITGITATTTAEIPVTVVDVVDAPTLTFTPVVGFEDQAIPLAIDGALSAFGSDATLTIANIPDGSTLSGGIQNADGTWTVSGDSIAGLTLTPPEDFSGDLHLDLTAAGTLADGSYATVTAPLDLSVLPVADEPAVSVADATGIAGDPIALNLSAALTDTDGSEDLALLIAGLPGGTTLSAGTDNGDGTWSLTAEDLNGLTLTSTDLPWSLPLTLTATATETDGSTATVAVPFVVSVTDSIVETAPLDPLQKTA